MENDQFTNLITTLNGVRFDNEYLPGVCEEFLRSRAEEGEDRISFEKLVTLIENLENDRHKYFVAVAYAAYEIDRDCEPTRQPYSNEITIEQLTESILPLLEEGYRETICQVCIDICCGGRENKFSDEDIKTLNRYIPNAASEEEDLSEESDGPDTENDDLSEEGGFVPRRRRLGSEEGESPNPTPSSPKGRSPSPSSEQKKGL